MKPVDELLQLARVAVDGRLDHESDRGGLQRLAHAVAGTRAPAAIFRRWAAVGSVAVVGAGLAAGLAVFLAISARARLHPAPVAALAYTVAVESSPSADASAPRGTTRWRFADGTTVAAADPTVVQVEGNAIDEPRIRINQKLAHVHVVHRPRTTWTFLAGPFQVRVTGTTFDLGWDPGPGTLTLRLLEGSVTLSGPRVPGGGLPVRAGERIQLALDTGLTVETAPTASPGLAVPPPSPAPEVSDVGPAPPAVVVAPTPRANASAIRRHSRGDSWRDLVRRGDFQSVIDQAGARRWTDCATRCSAEELRALGDAARYLNRLTLAERAYQTLRARDPGSDEGTAAAYLLARTFEAGRHWADADRWYALYLREAPGGTFVVEASSGRTRVAAQRRAGGSDRE